MQQTNTFTISYPNNSEILWRHYCDVAEVVGTVNATISLRGRKVIIVTTERNWTIERIATFFAERDMNVIVDKITVTEEDAERLSEVATNI